jgi:hypothetical protein
MAPIEEHPESYGWWLNELESLGISAKRTNELNVLNEISILPENVKRGFYQEHESRTSTIGRGRASDWFKKNHKIAEMSKLSSIISASC